jgi:RNA polymerase sigma factor (sigma-70 family)
MSATDLEPLVLAAAAGDRSAFSTLVTETSGVVSSIALAIVRDLDLSRDIAQDVFLAAWRDLARLRNPASFLPWLRQLTRNRAHHVLRTTIRRERRMSSGDDAGGVLAAVADARPDPAAQIIAEEDRAALAEALAALPDETREVVTLYYREGQSTAQVAALLELDETAVRKRLSRARASLKAALLARAALAIEHTTPGATFTAAIVAALPLTANTAGAATAAAAAKSLKVGLVAKLIAATGGAAVGAAGGMFGVVFGSHKLLREARDEQERRAVRRFTAAGVATVVIFSAMFPVTSTFPHAKVAATVNFALFIATLGVLYHVWLPRIIARRLEAEAREDPERALRRRRAERRARILGWTLGLTFGTLGLILGTYLE